MISSTGMLSMTENLWYNKQRRRGAREGELKIEKKREEKRRRGTREGEEKKRAREGEEKKRAREGEEKSKKQSWQAASSR